MHSYASLQQFKNSKTPSASNSAFTAGFMSQPQPQHQHQMQQQLQQQSHSHPYNNDQFQQQLQRSTPGSFYPVDTITSSIYPAPTSSSINSNFNLSPPYAAESHQITNNINLISPQSYQLQQYQQQQQQQQQQQLLQHQQQPLLISDQINRMLNGKLSLTHNQSTPTLIGNFHHDALLASHYHAPNIKPNEYFQSIQKYEKDSKSSIGKKQLKQSPSYTATLTHNSKEVQPPQESIGKSNNSLKSSTKQAQSTKTPQMPKKQLTINTAEVQSTYNFQNPNGVTPNASQKASPVARPFTSKTSSQQQPSKPNPQQTQQQQQQPQLQHHQNQNVNPVKPQINQISVSQASSPTSAASYSGIMKQLSPKYQQQIKLYDGVLNFFQPQQQQQLSQSQAQQQLQKSQQLDPQYHTSGFPAHPSSSQSPKTKPSLAQSQITSQSQQDPFFLSPKHPKSQPQSTKNQQSTQPKYFEFPSQSQILNRNPQVHSAVSQNLKSSTIATTTTTAATAGTSSKNLSINLQPKKQNYLENSTNSSIAKNTLEKSQKISSAKLPLNSKQTQQLQLQHQLQQTQSQNQQPSSTRDCSVQKSPQPDLNAIYQRTSAVIKNFQHQKELWAEEKTMLINEIITLRNRISFYQQEESHPNPQKQSNSFFESQNHQRIP